MQTQNHEKRIDEAIGIVPHKNIDVGQNYLVKNYD